MRETMQMDVQGPGFRNSRNIINAFLKQYDYDIRWISAQIRDPSIYTRMFLKEYTAVNQFREIMRQVKVFTGGKEPVNWHLVVPVIWLVQLNSVRFARSTKTPEMSVHQKTGKTPMCARDGN